MVLVCYLREIILNVERGIIGTQVVKDSVRLGSVNRWRAHRTGPASRVRSFEEIATANRVSPNTPGNGCVPVSVNLPSPAPKVKCRVAPVIAFGADLFETKSARLFSAVKIQRPTPLTRSLRKSILNLR